MTIYSWQQNQWNHIQAYLRGEGFPHALLLTGPKNLGKLFFAQLLAKRLLCQKQLEFACGVCPSCQLVLAGSHPDLILVEPAADGKMIKIEQIRELVEQLSQTAQQGSYQVVIIDPAEAMNKAAANALLKTLEEPSGQVVFLLISHQPGMLPATIASRCQKINFLIPAKAESAAWLEQKLPVTEQHNLSLLLALAENIPLRALALYEENALVVIDKVIDSFLQMNLGKLSVLEMATLCAATDQELVFNALWSVIMDLVRLKVDKNVVLMNVHKRETLLLAVEQVSRSRLFDLLDHLALAKRQIEEKMNLNSQLLYENLFI